MRSPMRSGRNFRGRLIFPTRTTVIASGRFSTSTRAPNRRTSILSAGAAPLGRDHGRVDRSVLRKNPGHQMAVIAGGGHLVYAIGHPKRTFRRNGLSYTII